MGIIRKTKTVKLILNEFSANNKTISATELVEKFNNIMDKTTVYRILERLENSSLIHSFMNQDGHKRYALGEKDLSLNKKLNSHPHFQCEDCGTSLCLPIKIIIPSVSNYLIKSAEHILTGQCESCLDNR
ncbi:MAG: transcriptional regulator [Candidatus Marinimicrobia bacterium]|nr:transcriptional regulator [Candidatus Neomarinimicrobiota bacterium]|tara:strand:- start:1963 stop:2352 length:390 start_codon:yes stop_codon:yes gene_type:complete